MADTAELTLDVDDTSVSGGFLDLNVTPYSDNEQLKIGTQFRLPPEFQRCSIGGFSGTVLPASVTSDTTLTGSNGSPDTAELGADLTLGDGEDATTTLTVGL